MRHFGREAQTRLQPRTREVLGDWGCLPKPSPWKAQYCRAVFGGDKTLCASVEKVPHRRLPTSAKTGFRLCLSAESRSWGCREGARRRWRLEGYRGFSPTGSEGSLGIGALELLAKERSRPRCPQNKLRAPAIPGVSTYPQPASNSSQIQLRPAIRRRNRSRSDRAHSRAAQHTPNSGLDKRPQK